MIFKVMVDTGHLRERMVRIEGLFEGFTARQWLVARGWPQARLARPGQDLSRQGSGRDEVRPRLRGP